LQNTTGSWAICLLGKFPPNFSTRFTSSTFGMTEVCIYNCPGPKSMWCVAMNFNPLLKIQNGAHNEALRWIRQVQAKSFINCLTHTHNSSNLFILLSKELFCLIVRIAVFSEYLHCAPILFMMKILISRLFRNFFCHRQFKNLRKKFNTFTRTIITSGVL
jgi:hypothetical protein